jgi:hypothetical protein
MLLQQILIERLRQQRQRRQSGAPAPPDLSP